MVAVPQLALSEQCTSDISWFRPYRRPLGCCLVVWFAVRFGFLMSLRVLARWFLLSVSFRSLFEKQLWFPKPMPALSVPQTVILQAWCSRCLFPGRRFWQLRGIFGGQGNSRRDTMGFGFGFLKILGGPRDPMCGKRGECLSPD